MVGPDGAGKTHLLEKAKELFDMNFHSMAHHHPLIIPTIGLNTAKITADRVHLLFWDLGGKKALRSIWRSYLSTAHAIVYVFDCSSPSNFPDAKEALFNLLNLPDSALQTPLHDTMPSPPPDTGPPTPCRMLPILLYGNKEDQGAFNTPAQLLALFDLPPYLPTHLELSCALTGSVLLSPRALTSRLGRAFATAFAGSFVPWSALTASETQSDRTLLPFLCSPRPPTSTPSLAGTLLGWCLMALRRHHLALWLHPRTLRMLSLFASSAPPFRAKAVLSKERYENCGGRGALRARNLIRPTQLLRRHRVGSVKRGNTAALRAGWPARTGIRLR